MSFVRPQILRLCAALLAAWMSLGAQSFAAEADAAPANVTTVPEPSVVLTLVGGAAVLVALQRRRRW